MHNKLNLLVTQQQQPHTHKSLEAYGIKMITDILSNLGLKCGGNLTDRCQRLLDLINNNYDIKCVNSKQYHSTFKAIKTTIGM